MKFQRMHFNNNTEQKNVCSSRREHSLNIDIKYNYIEQNKNHLYACWIWIVLRFEIIYIYNIYTEQKTYIYEIISRIWNIRLNYEQNWNFNPFKEKKISLKKACRFYCLVVVYEYKGIYIQIWYSFFCPLPSFWNDRIINLNYMYDKAF